MTSLGFLISCVLFTRNLRNYAEKFMSQMQKWNTILCIKSLMTSLGFHDVMVFRLSKKAYGSIFFLMPTFIRGMLVCSRVLFFKLYVSRETMISTTSKTFSRDQIGTTLKTCFQQPLEWECLSNRLGAMSNTII